MVKMRDVTESLIAYFEENERDEGSNLTILEAAVKLDLDPDVVKHWFSMPTTGSPYLIIGRQGGVKVVNWSPVSEIRIAIATALRNSRETGEVPVDDVKRVLHAWSLMAAKWRERIAKEVSDRKKNAIKNATPRSAQALDTLLQAMLTFGEPDPEA